MTRTSVSADLAELAEPIDPGDTHTPPTLWAWVMIGFSLCFLLGYSIIALVPNLSQTALTWILLVLGAIWVVFLVEYVSLFIQSKQGWRFVPRHWFFTVTLLIPVARPFLLFRYLNQLEYFRRATGTAIRIRLFISAASFALLFVYMISLIVLRFERDAPGANIVNFGDAVWWAFVTIATVGYGDVYPVTVPGRFFAVILMMGGVAIVGTASALVISYLSEHTAATLKSHKVDSSTKGTAE